MRIIFKASFSKTKKTSSVKVSEGETERKTFLPKSTALIFHNFPPILKVEV